MEAVTDKLIAELKTFSETAQEDGGLVGILDIQSIYFGDPGIIPVYLYPAIFVQPMRDDPVGETTGYEIRGLEILLSLEIDAREFFDMTVEEAKGDRQLTQAATAMRKWLRRVANRRLDGEAGNVREVAIDNIAYNPAARGTVITKSAQLTAAVNKQYPKER
jgi:hypothetical protein